MTMFHARNLQAGATLLAGALFMASLPMNLFWPGAIQMALARAVALAFPVLAVGVILTTITAFSQGRIGTHPRWGRMRLTTPAWILAAGVGMVTILCGDGPAGMILLLPATLHLGAEAVILSKKVSV